MKYTACVRPYWFANAIEFCTKQARNRLCAQPLAIYKTARYSLILPTKMVMRMRYVHFTFFMWEGSIGTFEVNYALYPA